MKVIMPQLGETVTEGTVAAWHKEQGDTVEADEVLLDVETDKAAIEINAPVAGVLVEISVGAGETVDVGTTLAVIREEGKAPSKEADPASDSGAEGAGSAAAAPQQAAIASAASASKKLDHGKANGEGPPLSPAVRRLLAESGIEPSAVTGTGKGGRITKNDVLKHLELRGGDGSGREPAAGDSSKKPFNRIRRITAERMVASKAVSPHVLQAVEVDFTAVDRARGRVGMTWKDKHGFSLTYLPFVARAVCDALKEFPHLNSSVQGDGLVVHRRVHLAIAVDLGEGGLVAPVIESADQLSVAELAGRIDELSGQARSGKLQTDQLSGGTYTISNSGTFGTMITAPIINQPQVAILSLDGIKKRPVAIETPGGDSIAIRRVGILAQSFDHRAVDGAYSAGFLSALRDRLEKCEWDVKP